MRNRVAKCQKIQIEKAIVFFEAKGGVTHNCLEVRHLWKTFVGVLLLTVFLTVGCNKGKSNAENASSVNANTTTPAKTIPTSKNNSESLPAAKSKASTPKGKPLERAETVSEAVAAIKKLDGSIEFEGNDPSKPVINVNLLGSRIVNADLVHLRVLTKLKSLSIALNLKITDAGLVHLQGLTDLESLDLGQLSGFGESITDDGLVYVEEHDEARIP
jgi:hypothetical protein